MTEEVPVGAAVCKLVGLTVVTGVGVCTGVSLVIPPANNTVIVTATIAIIPKIFLLSILSSPIC